MGPRVALSMSVLLAVTGGCSESSLRAGHCERDLDCPSGQYCVLQGAATFTCAVADGSLPDGDVPDGVPGADAMDVKPECGVDSECPLTKPICDTGSCRPCNASRPGDGAACASRNGALPVCGPNGSCVGCASATSADCNVDRAKPICDLTSNTCVKCATDDQCAAKGAGPGICMSHQDGRCAADSEVIYVENKAGCSSSILTTTAGSAALPFCGPQVAIDGLTSARRVIVISGTVSGFQWAPSGADAPVSVFGRNAAVIAGGAQPGIVITGGADLFVRGPLTVGPGPQLGISASSGAVLRLDGVTIDSNRKGGVLVDGAAFDLRNSTIVGNGPGDVMGFPWGGIRLQNAPTAGPALLNSMTIRNNNPVGLSCATTVTGNGVLATGNTSVDIAATCGIVACSPAGPTCGAP